MSKWAVNAGGTVTESRGLSFPWVVSMVTTRSAWAVSMGNSASPVRNSPPLPVDTSTPRFSMLSWAIGAGSVISPYSAANEASSAPIGICWPGPVSPVNVHSLPGTGSYAAPTAMVRPPWSAAPLSTNVARAVKVPSGCRLNITSVSDSLAVTGQSPASSRNPW